AGLELAFAVVERVRALLEGGVACGRCLLEPADLAPQLVRFVLLLLADLLGPLACLFLCRRDDLAGACFRTSGFGGALLAVYRQIHTERPCTQGGSDDEPDDQQHRGSLLPLYVSPRVHTRALRGRLVR